MNGVDFVIDFIGINYFFQNVNVFWLDGIFYFFVFMFGVKFLVGVSMVFFLGKRLIFKGFILRFRSLEYQVKLLKMFEEKILFKIFDDIMIIKVYEVSLYVLVYMESIYVNIFLDLFLV